MKFFLLITFTSFVYCNRLCYDCNPTEQNKCLSPKDNNVRTVNCLDEYEKSSQLTTLSVGDESGLEFVCFTLRTEKGNNTGIYRGCRTQTSVGDDVCGSLEKDFQQYNVSICKICSYDNCNVENLETETDTKDDDNSNDGGTERSLSVGIFILSAMFFLVLRH